MERGWMDREGGQRGGGEGKNSHGKPGHFRDAVTRRGPEICCPLSQLRLPFSDFFCLVPRGGVEGCVGPALRAQLCLPGPTVTAPSPSPGWGKPVGRAPALREPFVGAGFPVSSPW